MGKVMSMMTRPIRNYNVERRAHKVISREKPMPAPRYEANLKQLKLAEELNPEFMEKQSKKDSQLNANLKDVYVLSNDPLVQSDLHNRSDSRKSLPKSRTSSGYDDIHLYQIENVKEGRCSLVQLQTFLTNHMDNPLKYNTAYIAEKYKLDKKVAENLLEHYKVFRMLSKDDLEKLKEKTVQKKLVTAKKPDP